MTYEGLRGGLWTMFGRSEINWEAIVDEATGFLKEQARLKRVTTYTELNAALGLRGHKTFDFAHENDRRALGAVLGQVVTNTIGDTGVMLSSIVAYLDRNDAGPGFYMLATELGLLPKTASPDAKYAFWLDQVNRVHALHAGPPRRGSRSGTGDMP